MSRLRVWVVVAVTTNWLGAAALAQPADSGIASDADTVAAEADDQESQNTPKGESRPWSRLFEELAEIRHESLHKDAEQGNAERNCASDGPTRKETVCRRTSEQPPCGLARPQHRIIRRPKTGLVGCTRKAASCGEMMSKR